MPRTCTVCTHAEREAIDQALVSGEPFRHIAARTGTSTGALQRHKQEHIPEALAKATEARELAHADSLAEQIQNLSARTMRILDKAEKAGDLRTALAAIGQAKGVLELKAKVAEKVEEAPQIQFNPLAPDFSKIDIRNVIAYPCNPATMIAPEGVVPEGYETRRLASPNEQPVTVEPAREESTGGTNGPLIDQL